MFKTTRWPLVVQSSRKMLKSSALVLQFFWCLKHATSKKLRLRLWFQPSVNWTWRKLVLMCAGVYRQKILNLFNTTPFMCTINSVILLVFLKWTPGVEFTQLLFQDCTFPHDRLRKHGAWRMRLKVRLSSGCLHHAPVPLSSSHDDSIPHLCKALARLHSPRPGIHRGSN